MCGHSGQYINSSEAVWRILSFPVLERYPPIFHLSVHLENGKFDSNNPNQLANQLTNPPKTTLTAFFGLYKIDHFAKTLLYVEVPSKCNRTNKKFE